MMLLVEEKRVPVKISLVPMRSYGDKPREFIQKVPSGLLPAMEVNGQIITESQVIMELLDQWHPESDGYLPMLPEKDDRAGLERYNKLARLEREYVLSTDIHTTFTLMIIYYLKQTTFNFAHAFSP